MKKDKKIVVREDKEKAIFRKRGGRLRGSRQETEKEMKQRMKKVWDKEQRE